MGTEKLTAAQKAAIENRGGPLLVSAAAGSGKTKVLVDRLMKYILDESAPANIDDFLIITYTKAAASELRGKIASKLMEHLAQNPLNRHLRHQLQRLYLAKISTVHSFCSDVLREYAFYLELPGDMRVADETEAAELRQMAMEKTLEEAYRCIAENEGFGTFIDTQGFGRDDRAVPQIVEKVYTSAQCHVQPEVWLKGCISNGDTAGFTDASQTLWGEFLLNRLHSYLDSQITVYRHLLSVVQTSEDLGPKYCPCLEDDLYRVERLRNCRKWESCRENYIGSLVRLASVRNPSEPELVEQVKAVREALKKGLARHQAPFDIPSAQIFKDLEQANLANEGLFELVLNFTKAYEDEKKRHRVLDFGDLEHLTLRLLLGKNLTGPTRAAQEIGSRFREVMVDEYQDTNEVQDRIFSTLTYREGNLFMVGDVKQSIYRFRLADPSIFLSKYHSYKPHEEAAPGEGRKIMLSENFRSGEAVLAAANHVFRTSMCPQVGGLYYGEAEALLAGIPHEKLPQTAVELHCIELMGGANKYESEARFVADRIKELLNSQTMIPGTSGLRPVTPEDIVILLRSPGTGGRYYREALENLGIPVTTDAGSSILETGEISILRSFLQVLDNPLQDIPLQAVLLSPIFDFSADRLGQLRAMHREGNLYDGLLYAKEQGQADAESFLNLLSDLRRIARQETLTRLLDEIYNRTHLEAVFSAMSGGIQRRNNLRFFYETAAAFEQGGRRDLGEFLEHLTRLESRGLKPEEPSGGGAVSIVSIHKSKGLEYPVVFLSNLSGRFNLDDLKSNVLADPVLGIGSSAVNQNNRSRYPTVAKTAVAQRTRDENISEELRVLYVAMTRAKDMLIMTYADKYLQSHLTGLRCRLMPENNYALAQEAGCLGDWVLMAALRRSESAELFQQAGRPEDTIVDGYPWQVCYHALAPEVTVNTPPEEAEPGLSAKLPTEQALQELLTFHYPHKPSITAPSKVTATQLKGRELDTEAADGAFHPLPTAQRHFKKPAFLENAPLTGQEIGTATHLAMQFIRYEACVSPEGVETELKRLLAEEFLTQRQFEAVNREWIMAFFTTDLGRRLQKSKNVLREFKFSILEDGKLLDEDLAGEKLLLQGVVDCCLMEDDGLTVLDFKTDNVRPGQEEAKANHYAPQVQTYGKALSKIWEKPVKKLLLYFFRTGRLWEVPVE